MIKVHAHLKWAEQLINRAVELMPLEQLGQWEGVRTWQEYNPVDELTENLQENWQQIYTEHAAQQKLLREVQYIQENIEEIQERVANLRGFIRVTLDYTDQGGNTHPLWEILEQTRRLREHLERIQVQTSDCIDDLLESKDLD